MSKLKIVCSVAAVLLFSALAAPASPVAGKSGSHDLVIADAGRTEAVVVVAPEAKGWERRAAEDLVNYIGLMTGVRPALATNREAIDAALKGKTPVLLVGSEALKARRQPLEKSLNAVVKKNPVLRADAIVIQRDGNRVYLAGTNEESHYYAVAELLRLWGCRWFMANEFGECIPEQRTLSVGALNLAYAPPFEVRYIAGYAWLGDNTGKDEFDRRNGMNELSVPCGHSMHKYMKKLVPTNTTFDAYFKVPIAEETTIREVAAAVEKDFSDGKNFSMGMDDGPYASASSVDKTLRANLYDKYFNGQMLTDNFMTLYNGVFRILLEKYPASPSHVGFFAYVNMTIPPQHEIKAAKPLVAYLAPIDIDPNHGMDDPRSPPRQEYAAILQRWSQVMDGRVVIYDYDQGMLVWRDLPNPSHQAFRQDVKHYRDAGILGLHTESRCAYDTVFLNLYLRARLMWNPNESVDTLLAEFYPLFYGPAAEPMSRYWGAIYKAWDDTILTEHEFFVAPAVYTEALVKELRTDLEAAQKAMAPLRGRDEKTLSRNERLYLKRLAFTERSFEIIDGYMAMVRTGATEADYKPAVAAGERALAAREALTKMNGTFTSTRMEGKGDPAWLPGEVALFRELQELTGGTNGALLARLPLEWAFHRDPNDTGMMRGFAYTKPDLTYWKANQARYTTPWSRKDYPTTEWEVLRSDLYAQAQGVLHPDGQAFAGYMWYQTDVDLTARKAEGNVHVRFPGLFSEAWLYVNGFLVAYRPQNLLWCENDYRFNWDVDLTGHLKPGQNSIVLRVYNTHHNGGLFRRPFLYQPNANAK